MMRWSRLLIDVANNDLVVNRTLRYITNRILIIRRMFSDILPMLCDDDSSREIMVNKNIMAWRAERCFITCIVLLTSWFSKPWRKTLICGVVVAKFFILNFYLWMLLIYPSIPSLLIFKKKNGNRVIFFVDNHFVSSTIFLVI